MEWHPATTLTTAAAVAGAISTTEYETLAGLLSKLSSAAATSTSVAPDFLKTFLTSDLGAPLPLHISLSRPLSLTTGNKDAFLDAVRAALAHGAGVPVFSLRPTGLEWHRTAESARSFLVLRVEPVAPDADAERSPGEKQEKNRELTQLLRRCNGVAQSFGQPALYAFASGRGDDNKKEGSERLGTDNSSGSKVTTMDVGDAFHISVAWSFEPLSPELIDVTRQVFEAGNEPYRDRVRDMRVRVDGIKAKIGNVVTHIALPEAGTKGLFGL